MTSKFIAKLMPFAPNEHSRMSYLPTTTLPIYYHLDVWKISFILLANFGVFLFFSPYHLN
jgi:nitrate/nitrite transporter NarK